MTGSKRHIAFVLTDLGGGGAERNTLDLAGSLARRGHRVDLLVPRLAGDYQTSIPRGIRVYRARLPHTDRKFLRAVRGAGFEVQAMPVNPLGVARAWRTLRRRHPGIPVIRGRGLRSVYPYAHILARYIREVGPDLVVSALQGPNAVAVSAAALTDRAVPTVITVHNNVAADYAPQWLAAARALYPLADAVVAVSGGVAESVRQSLGVDAGRVRVIHNGVPLDRIRRLAREAVAHPWFRPGAPPVILAVGREAPAKDYPTLVEAFALAHRELGARLLILGRLSAPCRAGLQSLARGPRGGRGSGLPGL